jgi:hypothetical protein
MSSTDLMLRSLAEPKEAPTIQWVLDCPARGVVILDVTIAQDVSTAPLHWRAGDWTKPPLDLRLSQMGALESIQFIFQDEAVDAGQGSLPAESEIGLPTFDVREWSGDRYMDVRTAVTTLRLASGELYTAIGEEAPERSVSVTWGLRLGFGSSDQLVAIALGPLTADEWKMVGASASPGR